MKRRILLIIAVLALVAGVAYWLESSGQESTDDAFIEAHVIPIIPKVPGYVTALHITDNQPVKAGDVMLEIDPRDYQIALDGATARYENAKRELARMTGMTNIARSRRDLDDATAQEATSRAELERAQKDFDDAVMKAPEDGIVTKRGVEQGTYVQPGQQLFALVTPKRWVVANFKETQLKHMRQGQKVTIKVDAYPDLKLSGKVESFQQGTGARFSAFPAENATGNYVKIIQRVPVRIAITSEIPANIVLGPGMSVVPSVDTE